MLNRIAAQGLTDAGAAVALVAYVLAAVRRGRRSPVELRVMALFCGLSLFFALRGVNEIANVPALGVVTDALVSLLPMTGLFLVEGLMRRHAPGWLKIVMAVSSLAIFTGMIVSPGLPFLPTWTFEVYILLSLLAVTGLLVTRDRATLSAQENMAIDAIMGAGSGLLILSATDFVPSAPIGLSSVGAALLAFVTGARPGAPRQVRTLLLDLAVMVVMAAVITFGIAHALAMTALAEIVRLGALIMTLVLAMTALLRILHAGGAWDAGQKLRQALAAADTTDLGRFIDSLAGQPLLSGFRLAEGGLLADYDPAALAEILKVRAVWSRHTLNDQPGAGRGCDELADLMTRTEASHATLLSSDPLRIALLTLPDFGAADAVETDLALFGKLAIIAARGGTATEAL